jgi:hypothetical protein
MNRMMCIGAAALALAAFTPPCFAAQPPTSGNPVFFSLSCPDCGAEMRILPFLTEPFTVTGILRHVGLPTSAPPLSPARSPPPEDPDFGADPSSISTRRPPTIPPNPTPSRSMTSIRPSAPEGRSSAASRGSAFRDSNPAEAAPSSVRPEPVPRDRSAQP